MKKSFFYISIVLSLLFFDQALLCALQSLPQHSYPPSLSNRTYGNRYEAQQRKPYRNHRQPPHMDSYRAPPRRAYVPPQHPRYRAPPPPLYGVLPEPPKAPPQYPHPHYRASPKYPQPPYAPGYAHPDIVKVQPDSHTTEAFLDTNAASQAVVLKESSTPGVVAITETDIPPVLTRYRAPPPQIQQPEPGVVAPPVLTVQTPIQQPEIVTHSHDDFSSGPADWKDTAGKDVHTTSPLKSYAGPFGSKTIYKEIDISNAASYVSIAFKFFEFDSWDGTRLPALDGKEGDTFAFLINDKVVLHNPYHWDKKDVYPYIRSVSMGRLAHNNHWQDEIHHATVPFKKEKGNLVLLNPDGTPTATIFPVINNKIKLGFKGRLGQKDINDESWGVSDVVVQSAETLEALMKARH